MRNFFKNNWFGIFMTAGIGTLTWLTYVGGKFDGRIEAYTDCHNMLKEVIEKAEMESTE